MDEELNKKEHEAKTAQDEIRPNFLRTTDKLKKQDAAIQSLGEAEKSASANEPEAKKSNGIADAINAENKTGFYTGGGKVVAAKKATKGKFSLKKGGASFAVFLVIFLAAGLIGLVQVFQPFDLLAQFKETFNSMHTSANLRADRFFRAQMETGRTKNPLKGNKIFGYDFKISETQQEKLKTQGIEYDDTTFKDSDGKAIKVLKYETDSGEVKVIGADDTAVNKLNSLVLQKFDTDGIKYSAEAISFKNIYANDTNFFRAYNSGSMTWRGAIANWFGNTTSTYLTNNKLTRNRFQDWQKKLSAEGEGADSLELMKKTIAEGSEEYDTGGSRVTSDEQDEDGKVKTESSESERVNRTDMNASKIQLKLDELSGKFNTAANAGCAVVGFIGAVNLLVQASEMMQIMNLTTSYFEVIDKTEYGLGDDVPINDIANSLNEKKENTHEIISDDGSTTTEVTSNKSAMESAGVAALYDGSTVDPDDPSVSSFNILASSKKILGGLGEDSSSFMGCAVAKIGAAGLSAIADGVEIAECVAGIAGAAATVGASAVAGCAPLVGKIVIQVGFAVALTETLEKVVELLTPTVTSAMTRNLISDLGGEDLGNALTSGANIYQGGTHRANGGSLASIEKYEEFAVEQQQVIAENAKYERESLSPFDITSGNTFLGTILTQLASFTSAKSLMTTVTAGKSSVSSSLIAMLPSAAAAKIAETLPDNIGEYEDINPYLASINAIGDSYGNPYSITDVSTMEEDPADVIDIVNNYGGLDSTETSDGNVVVNKDSELAKYIRYCNNRTSPFGVADQNIANEFSTGTSNSIINGAIGAVPVIGDALEIIQDTEQLNNIGYISGESCVAGNSSSTLSWDEGKYYQRFIEDQSLAESMGLIDKSAAVAYMEEYYEENPLDNSYEGILARYSGMTKDDVVALLDVMEYYNFIASYDASDRYAFGESAIEDDEAIEFDNENVLAGEYVLPNQIVYADVRNRVFTV